MAWRIDPRWMGGAALNASIGRQFEFVPAGTRRRALPRRGQLPHLNLGRGDVDGRRANTVRSCREPGRALVRPAARRALVLRRLRRRRGARHGLPRGAGRHGREPCLVSLRSGHFGGCDHGGVRWRRRRSRARGGLHGRDVRGRRRRHARGSAPAAAHGRLPPRRRAQQVARRAIRAAARANHRRGGAPPRRLPGDVRGHGHRDVRRRERLIAQAADRLQPLVHARMRRRGSCRRILGDAHRVREPPAARAARDGLRRGTRPHDRRWRRVVELSVVRLRGCRFPRPARCAAAARRRSRRARIPARQRAHGDH